MELDVSTGIRGSGSWWWRVSGVFVVDRGGLLVVRYMLW